MGVIMFRIVICFIVVTSSQVLSRVAYDRPYTCSIGEVPCADGACVSADRLCDGRADCRDGGDEVSCGYSSSNGISLEEPVINRLRRQATNCRKNQWQCRDGSCIGFDGKCDGAVDCPDRSDESHALCRKMQCQFNWFRCTYGACVDGTAPCNGIQECADNSDELLPRCRNGTDVVRGQFKCADGQTVPEANRCDGVPDCTDGSDETVRACAAQQCPSHLFQCAYGACVDQGSDCNGQTECADGSDEADDLCNRMGTSGTTPVNKPTGGKCLLPDYPRNGKYKVEGAPNAVPGQTFANFQVVVTCNPGYSLPGENKFLCVDGNWSPGLPGECVKFCRLTPHPSVEYLCRIPNSIDGYRKCSDLEPNGTIVKLECRKPNYYRKSGDRTFINCIDGSWDYPAVCSPECGRITPGGKELIVDGWLAERGELPWHAGIYRKTKPYKQICGGTLVSTTVVVSAAHCFWNNLEEVAIPARNFAVALGKLYRPYNDPMDKDAQKSDVSDIKMPTRFQGAAANFQDDIAIVLLTTTIVYKTYVRPICIDFDINFDRRQLGEGKVGKVAGWGLTAENGNASQVLKVVNLPYVKIEKCISESPVGFREYITSDKICAGFTNGTALCKGDSGGGLVFPESDKGVDRYYLRGIVSTAPNNDNLCNAFTLTTFTQIIKHEYFITEFINQS